MTAAAARLYMQNLGETWRVARRRALLRWAWPSHAVAFVGRFGGGRDRRVQ